MRNSRSLAAVLALLLAFGAAACGDDGDTETSTEADSGAAETSDEAAAEGEPVQVTMVDYGYQDLPATVSSGTKLTVRNDSEEEIHELVAIKLPDEEERPADELAALPEDELLAIVGPADPATVLVATPGSDETIPVVGDGTLAEAGRYLVICFIPQGTDPQQFLEDAQSSEGPPAPQEGTGPPHLVLGMFGDLTVE